MQTYLRTGFESGRRRLAVGRIGVYAGGCRGGGQPGPWLSLLVWEYCPLEAHAHLPNVDQGSWDGFLPDPLNKTGPRATMAVSL